MARGQVKLTVESEAVEGPWALPEKWRWASLGSVASSTGGGRLKLNKSHYAEEGYPAFSAAGQDGLVREWEFEDDAVVLSSIGARCGKSFYATGRWTSLANTQCIFPREGLNARYLWYFSNDEERWERSGSAQPFIKPATIKSLKVPLPPLDIQRRIVSRLDDLFNEVEDGEAALERARTDLATWRKALLKAAVTGELTADWRVANPPTETGADLLARILAERRTRWLADPRNKGKRYIEPAGPYAANLPELPDGWTWASVEQLATSGPTNGYSPAKSIDGEGTLALKLTATTSGQMRLDSKSVKALGETIDAASPLFLEGGDLLFQRGNTREYVGMAAIYDGPSKTYIYPDLMIRVRTGSRSLTDWLWRWSVSPHGRKYLMDAAQGGAGTMPKISGQTIRSMPVPLPPIAEQERVLELLKGALSGEASLPPADLEDASLSATLRQSILAAAFRGDLVA